MNNCKTYSSYKDSDIEWMGQVPSHWDVVPLKRHLLPKPGAIRTGPFGSQLLSSEMNDSAVKVYNQRTVLDGDFERGDNYISEEKYEQLKSFEVFPGDFLVTTRGTIGRCAVVPEGAERGILHPCLMRLQLDPHTLSNEYLRYLVQDAEIVLEQLLLKSNATTIEVIYSETLKSVLIPTPPLPEQEAIARFLDHKTAQIDALIAKKEALLARLADKRTALISQAVTQGLDPTVPMRDSGIEWLGEIPAHWKVVRLRYLLHTNPSKSEIVLADDEMVSFIPMEAVGEYGGLNLEIEKPLNEIGSGYTYFADNDVVVAKITPCFENGKGALASGLTNGIAFGTTELHVLRPSDSLDHRFLFHLTMSQPFRKLGESEMYGAGGQKRIPESFIRELRLGIPPLVEQVKIAQFIDYQVTEHERLQFQVQSAIGKLKQYRTALITNAVTGKIDVRDVPLPAASAVEMPHA